MESCSRLDLKRCGDPQRGLLRISTARTSGVSLDFDPWVSITVRYSMGSPGCTGQAAAIGDLGTTESGPFTTEDR